MKVNTTHPSFITFLENVTDTILTSVNIENYFSLPQDKKNECSLCGFQINENGNKS